MIYCCRFAVFPDKAAPGAGESCLEAVRDSLAMISANRQSRRRVCAGVFKIRPAGSNYVAQSHCRHPRPLCDDGESRDVAATMRQHIEQEALARGYRSNDAARCLKTGRSSVIDLVLPVSTASLNDSYYSELLLTLDQRLALHNMNLMILPEKSHD